MIDDCVIEILVVHKTVYLGIALNYFRSFTIKLQATFKYAEINKMKRKMTSAILVTTDAIVYLKMIIIKGHNNADRMLPSKKRYDVEKHVFMDH